MIAAGYVVADLEDGPANRVLFGGQVFVDIDAASRAAHGWAVCALIPVPPTMHPDPAPDAGLAYLEESALAARYTASA